MPRVARVPAAGLRRNYVALLPNPLCRTNRCSRVAALLAVPLRVAHPSRRKWMYSSAYSYTAVAADTGLQYRMLPRARKAIQGQEDAQKA